MKTHLITSAKRWFKLTNATLVITAVSLFGFGSTLLPSMMGQASAAGCVKIYNVGAEEYVTGNGSGNPVKLLSSGNCFTSIASGGSAYGDWNVWENGDGNCLWSNGAVLDLNSGCNTSGTAYQVISPGVSGEPGLNLMSTVALYGSNSEYFEATPKCSLGVAGGSYGGSDCFWFEF